MTAVRCLTTGDAPACDAIIAALPGFFGDPVGIENAAKDVRAQAGWVTEDGGRVTAFLTVYSPFPETVEISWLAVHPDFRRGGRGRSLIETAATDTKAHDARMLVLFTADAEDPPGVDGYGGTRRFYEAMGFVGLWQGRQAGWNQDSILMGRPLV